MTDSTAVFGTDGLLVKQFPGYEPRDGQLKMARAVEKALADRTHLVVEAPCGIGKSFSYLAPAIDHALRTETKVIICTANIALQEQLVTKDLPHLKELLPEPFRFELIKGIGNYLCVDRLNDAERELFSYSEPEQEERWQDLVAWAHATKTGDSADLPFVPPDGQWSRVNGVSDLCTSSQCRFYDNCFAMDARRRLQKADVIVTNYHLFFANLSLKIAADRDVLLPPAGAVICDEAHEMADIARDFFGRRLSTWSVNNLARGAFQLGLRTMSDRLRAESRFFFDRVRAFYRSGRYKTRLREGGFAEAQELRDTVRSFQKQLKDLGKAAPSEEIGDKIGKLYGAADGYLETLEGFLAMDDDNRVAWIEEERAMRGDEPGVRLCSRRIDVAGLLNEHLFGAVPTVILTSATLSNGSDHAFAFLKRETGAGDAKDLAVASPFSFRDQARLVVPSVTAAPNDPEYAPEISRSINKIIKTLGGRTLALFTSHKNMNLCAEEARKTGVEILRQGDKPRSQLLEHFRKDQGTALFATASFWQGIDVPGEALSCLIIDKIPFLTPEDPLVSALQEKDRETFMKYTLPKAIIDLRQGFGRLIRSKSDRGVVVIFDNRLFTARYGRDILSSLPEVRVSRDLDAVFTFLGKT